jgi:4-oxalocrotonate tautomerase
LLPDCANAGHTKRQFIVEGGDMPLVRIDLVEGKSEEYRKKVGEIVYQTLLDILSVPKHDRFQVITEHRKSGLSFDRDYVGMCS